VLGSIEVAAPIGVFETGYSETLRPAAREAARHGADAIVVLERGTNVTGVISTSSAFASASTAGNTAYGSGFGFGTATPMRQAHTRVLAIKFL
jgi:predicted TIM-barrel enzyme